MAWRLVLLLFVALPALVCEGAVITVDSCKLSVSKFSSEIDLSYPKSLKETDVPVLKKTATLKLTLEVHTQAPTSKEGVEAEQAAAADRGLDQVMLLLDEKREAGEGVSAVVAGKKEASHVEGASVARFTYTINASPSRLVKMLKGKEGEYEMTLVVGDRGVSNAFEWRIGVVNIQMEITGSREERKKAASVLPTMTAMKPEIQHTFREEEKRVPAMISYAFVAAIFAALPLLIILVSTTSSTLFDRFPSTAAGVAAALAFHACTLLCMYVLLQFFKRQYIFEWLPSIVGAGLITSLAGFALLSHLATTRIAEKSGRVIAVSAEAVHEKKDE